MNAKVPAIRALILVIAIFGALALFAAKARAAPPVITASAAIPKNTAPPTISGVARVGQELTANPGSWSGNPDSFAFQWQRCDVDGTNCFDVVGATGKTYGVRLADLGFRLRVRVT